ncbi:MAG: Asp-tRNA(Asn)/Glu-tRNA(Gln) amidotransferase GatCAB subunit A [Bacteroidetes bacterium]|nr:MAG: Asp-tRNA(Asn)/Glu-tRNA(Gln) amidotransferase GatCAB subunit A [Bacteroidota bacterium]
MYNSLSEIQKQLFSKQLSVENIVNEYLKKIKEETHLNAFVEVFEKEAKIQAKKIDFKIKQNNAGKLAGLVIGIKDNICYKGHKVTAGSKILENFVSTYHSTAVERLINEDAIIIGRLNCDEFAMGSSNETSVYGSVLNPFDETRVSGGSSGGSAVAVAADLCLAALGSDTGGSVRQPASFCGVVGLKPTYGRVSRYGLIAYASSFDQIGVLAKNISDVAVILEIIAGDDGLDSTVSDKAVPEYSKSLEISKNYKIAFLNNHLKNKELDPEIRDKILSVFDYLKSIGHSVKAVDFKLTDLLIPTYYVLTTAEASSNLSRYDGVRFGYRNTDSTNINSLYTNSRTKGFGEEVKRRIMTGTFVLSKGFVDEYFTKAQKVRRLIQNETNMIFSDFDFIISPTTPTTAFKLGTKTQNPVEMYLEDIFTVHANLVGIPAISIPLGKHSNGMPYGIQILSRKFDEQSLLAFADFLIQNKTLC